MSFCWKSSFIISGLSLSFQFQCLSAEPVDKFISGESSKPSISTSSAANPKLSIAPSDTFDTNSLADAKSIASNILSIVRNTKSLMQYGIIDIIKDHSIDHHEAGDSYFLTNDATQIETLINYVISNATAHKFFTTTRGKDRLALRKTITQAEALNIFNKDNIGYDERFSGYRNHVIICFDVTGILKLSDSTQKGGFLTAFPSRENFVCK